MSKPILFGGPGVPGEVEATSAAINAVKATLLPLVEQHCAVALVNALVTIYVEMGLGILGFEIMDLSIQTLRNELPRMAAVLRSDLDKPEGRA
jgi:hypothetical protein